MSGDLKERVEELLRSLGQTEDAVADTLRVREISGARGDGCLCPISNLIRTEFPEASDDREWGVSADWFVDITYVKTPDGIIDTPRPVALFISVFDDGTDHGDRPYDDLDDFAGDL